MGLHSLMELLFIMYSVLDNKDINPSWQIVIQQHPGLRSMHTQIHHKPHWPSSVTDMDPTLRPLQTHLCDPRGSSFRTQANPAWQPIRTDALRPTYPSPWPTQTLLCDLDPALQLMRTRLYDPNRPSSATHVDQALRSGPSSTRHVDLAPDTQLATYWRHYQSQMLKCSTSCTLMMVHSSYFSFRDNMTIGLNIINDTFKQPWLETHVGSDRRNWRLTKANCFPAAAFFNHHSNLLPLSSIRNTTELISAFDTVTRQKSPNYQNLYQYQRVQHTLQNCSNTTRHNFCELYLNFVSTNRIYLNDGTSYIDFTTHFK